MSLYNQIDSNKNQTWIIMILFVLIISVLGYVFGALTQYGSSTVVVAFIFSFISAFGSYYFSDSIALAISQAQEVSKENAPKLYRIVENLSIGAGVPTPKVYLIDDSAINAFATGRDPKHASIVFTTGAVDRLEDEELEGVAAHELSHIKNFDTRLMVIVVVLVGVITLLADWLIRMSWHKNNDRDKSGGIIVLIAVILGLLSPIFATLIKLAVSRKREYLADASGALLTRYPEGLAKALEKIAADKEPLEAANKATAHLYISNPLKNQSDAVSWFAGLFNTHPPLEDRINRLRAM